MSHYLIISSLWEHDPPSLFSLLNSFSKADFFLQKIFVLPKVLPTAVPRSPKYFLRKKFNLLVYNYPYYHSLSFSKVHFYVQTEKQFFLVNIVRAQDRTETKQSESDISRILHKYVFSEGKVPVTSQMTEIQDTVNL